MQKNIFTRYFTVVISVIFVSIAVLGAIMLIVAAQYFKDEKYDLLKKNTEQAAAFTVNNFESNNSEYLNYSVVYTTYTILANAIDADLFFVDVNGKPVVVTDARYNGISSYVIPQSILNQVDRGDFFEIGTLNGIFKGQYYTAGIQVKLSNGQTLGYMFASTPANSLMDFLIQILRMFCVSSVIVLVLSFIVVYFLTMQMTRPLKQMAVAAKRFGSGDFSARLPIRGNDEIAQLALALNNMAQSLSTLENVRRSFTANVSHELRTPMTTISGFVDGILDGTIPEEKQKEYLTIVSEEVKRLSRLVRSMLNLARIENGEVQLKVESFDVVDVILQTLFSFEKQIDEKQVEVRGLDRDKVIIEADKDLIHQVIYNLIENAVKFVNQGGYLEFSFRTEQGKTYIGIRNSGAGLSKEEALHVFERFYKSDKSRGLDKNGVGLGLHIVRSIINLHHGEILVRSTENEFTEFEFNVPSGKPVKVKKHNNARLPEIDAE